ncbi:hypothetical protein D3C73_565680 [compost metagenome]
MPPITHWERTHCLVPFAPLWLFVHVRADDERTGKLVFVKRIHKKILQPRTGKMNRLLCSIQRISVAGYLFANGCKIRVSIKRTVGVFRFNCSAWMYDKNRESNNIIEKPTKNNQFGELIHTNLHRVRLELEEDDKKVLQIIDKYNFQL